MRPLSHSMLSKDDCNKGFVLFCCLPKSKSIEEGSKTIDLCTETEWDGCVRQSVPRRCYHERNAESWTLGLRRNLRFKWSVKSKWVLWLQDTIAYRTLFRKGASVWHKASLPSLHLGQQTMTVFSVGNNVAGKDNSSNWWWTKCYPIYLLDIWVFHLTFHSFTMRFSLLSSLSLANYKVHRMIRLFSITAPLFSHAMAPNGSYMVHI